MSGIFQRKVLAIVSACVGLASLALAGDHINNGAGLAERNVLFAYANLEKYIGLCLDFPSCRITPYERGLLERIRNAMPTERAAPEQIRFLSEREHPGTFIIDGEMKIAKTGSQVGSAIYMNLDLLYVTNAAGAVTAHSLQDSVATLVHELGHHQGERAHTVLDVLGLKVAAQMARLTYVTPLLPLEAPVAVHVLNASGAHPVPEALLYVNNELMNVSEEIQAHIRCPLFSIPIGFGPFDGITIPSHPAKGMLVHNLHWKGVSDEDGATTFTAEGNLTMDCKDTGVANGNKDFKIRIAFSAVKRPVAEGFTWVLDRNSISVRQLHETWLSLISIGGSR